MDQRPTCDRTSSLARPPQTCTFWSKLWPVQIFVLAPKISQIPVLRCSKIRTFTQGEARCRVRLRSNFCHVAAAFLSHTGRFVIESICQENNIISNQWLPDLERYQKIGFVCFKKTEHTQYLFKKLSKSRWSYPFFGLFWAISELVSTDYVV